MIYCKLCGLAAGDLQGYAHRDLGIDESGYCGGLPLRPD